MQVVDRGQAGGSEDVEVDVQPPRRGQEPGRGGRGDRAVRCDELSRADQCPQLAGQRRDARGRELVLVPRAQRDDMLCADPGESVAQPRAESGVEKPQRQP